MLSPKVRSMLNKRGGKDILVIGGGIIPLKDKNLLKKRASMETLVQELHYQKL